MNGDTMHCETQKIPQRNLPGSVVTQETDPIRTRLTDEERDAFCTYARPVEIKKRQMLYCRGEYHVSVSMPVRGAVKLTRFTIDGREHIMDVVGAHGLFGSVAGMMARDTAVVVDDGIVAVLDEVGFERLVSGAPHLASGIRRVIDCRRERVENTLLDLLCCSVEQRLARAILHLLDDFCEPGFDGILLKVGLTHQDFADMIASTRETVTMKLNTFKKDGLIESQGRHLMVRSLCKMRHMTGL